MSSIDQQALLRPYLLAGERIAWTGQPRQGMILRGADLFMIPFSLLWGGFALFWNVMVWVTGAPLFFKLFGLPFLAVGFYVVIGRFMHDARLRRRIVYAVTDRRLLFLRTGPRTRFSARELTQLPVLEIEERAGGRGSIAFESGDGPFGFAFSRGRGWDAWVPALGTSARFLEIDGARAVYDLIVRAIEARRAAA